MTLCSGLFYKADFGVTLLPWNPSVGLAGFAHGRSSL